MSDDPQMTRRGFLAHATRKVKAAAAGGLIGSGLGVLSIEPNDTPQEQKRKVVGGAVLGAGTVAAVDHVRSRDPEREHQQRQDQYEEGMRNQSWRERAEDRYRAQGPDKGKH